jgi:hypothetical protein
MACVLANACLGSLAQDGWTVLHYAGQTDSPEVVELVLMLVEQKANIEVRDKVWPLDAIRASLRPSRAYLAPQAGLTPLMSAASYGSSAACAALVNSGADVNVVDNTVRFIPFCCVSVV